ncbi:class I SAM-dependent methyltransferase [uncultured Photobacterium sp.]|uniref:class I SAM-dependent methyltransferase n=1 Tax=uncultured Photobacterium sp. TaxID=173973 RepID=UPI002627EC00|nr:class I SAM-dependent methyltransferase [uncultured Photobacterium sp.]
MAYKKDAEAGQAVYSRNVLSIYDLWVLGISNSFIWRCSTRKLGAFFRRHVSLNHLDVGVGTGYYLDKYLPESQRRVGLLDLNANSLGYASQRIARFNPERYRGNVLEPLDLTCEAFDSISVNYLLHCLPGSIGEKSILFKHLKPYLNEAGVIFGSTILGDGVQRGMTAKKLMSVYNSKGIFDNNQDSLEGLREALESHFSQVEIVVVGCVAMFRASV